jgi:hypothetical protein
MAYFQTKSPNLGKFWWVLQWKLFYDHFVYFTDIWYILWPFGIFYGYVVYFSRFGVLYQEQSGNTMYVATDEISVCELAETETCDETRKLRRGRKQGTMARQIQ